MTKKTTASERPKPSNLDIDHSQRNTAPRGLYEHVPEDIVVEKNFAKKLEFDTPRIYSEEEKERMRSSIEYKRARDNQKIRVMFKYLESPGSKLAFDFGEYKGDPIVRYELEDGKVYDLPINVVRHLKLNTKRRTHRRIVDPHTMKNTYHLSFDKARTDCELLEYVDMSELFPNNEHINQRKRILPVKKDPYAPIG